MIKYKKLSNITKIFSSPPFWKTTIILHFSHYYLFIIISFFLSIINAYSKASNNFTASITDISISFQLLHVKKLTPKMLTTNCAVLAMECSQRNNVLIIVQIDNKLMSFISNIYRKWKEKKEIERKQKEIDGKMFKIL